MKLAEIAAQLEVRLRGDGEVEIKGLQGIADAQPGELTFVSNPKYVAAARTAARRCAPPGGAIIGPV